MQINFDKIEEIYGKDTLKDIRENIKQVTNNLNFLNAKRLNSINDIFERYPLMFLYDENEFKNKVNNLEEKYQQEIDIDLDLWGEIQ